MKKFGVFALAIAFAFALTGCGGPAESSSTASSPESSSTASTSSSASKAPATNWTSAKSAEEAAKGAGIDTFGAFEKVTVNETEFASPKFAYAGGVAQATYESGASALVLRKAGSKHEAPMSDFDTASLAEKWTKTYDGVLVTLYGPAMGAAQLITWSDGDQEYAVSFEGLGGEDVTMAADEVAAIVKAAEDANAAAVAPAQEEEAEEETTEEETTEETPAAEQPVQQEEPVATPDFNVEDAVWNNGLGELEDYYPVQGEDGNTYWGVVTRGSDGQQYTTYMDGNGNVLDQDLERGDVVDQG